MNLSEHTENLIKIDKQYLEDMNKKECEKYFGSWINDIDNLKKQF